jgi:hypothetical protein
MPTSTLRKLLALIVLLAATACRATPTNTGPIEVVTLAPGLGLSGTLAGQFDCSGHEAGLLAYAGRFTFAADGATQFEDFDGATYHTTYTFESEEQVYSFSDDFVFEYAEYFADDTLTARLAPDATLPHTELGEVTCEPAVPGVTGPP